jgi:hypothetical protein
LSVTSKAIIAHTGGQNIKIIITLVREDIIDSPK